MKLVTNNISPLPFYDDIALQNHRKDYAYGQVYPLITYRNMLLPFQVVLASGTSVNWVRLYDFNTGKFVDITTSMKENGLVLKLYTGFKLLKYPGIFPIVEIKYEGRYYLAISVSNLGTIYSDVFTVSNNVKDCLLIEYRNSYNFGLKNGIVDFSDNFGFKCYLNTQVGKPEYDFEEESTDRMGYTFIESQVSKKIYKFTFLAPEYLCDALRIVRLCEDKQITSKQQTYDLTTFNMEPDWEDQGDLASVECEFETDTVIANIGGYTPELVRECIGDYDEKDYNEDYNLDNCDVTGNDLVVTPENIEVPATGGTYQVQIMTTGEWRFVKYDPSGWYVVDKPEGELVTIVNLTIESNYTGAERTAVILIAGEDGDSATITVKQEAHSIKLSKKTLEYSATDTAAQTVSVESTTTWTTEIIQ